MKKHQSKKEKAKEEIEKIEYRIFIEFKGSLTNNQKNSIRNFLSTYSNDSVLDQYDLTIYDFYEESDAERCEESFIKKFSNLIK